MAQITQSSTLGFEFEMDYDEGLVEGDFVQANGPRGDPYVAQITHTETNNGLIEAKASVVGTYPDLPFREETPVEKAANELVLETLSLPSEGAHIGDLRDFGSPLYLSVEKLMEKHIGVFGRTGSGKSYTAGVLAEEFFNFDQPMVILDPHGEYASLKVKQDGTASDYRVVQYADLEFNPDADEDLDLESVDPLELVRPGQASVINLRGVDADRQEEVVSTLLEELFLARKRDQIPQSKVFLEEAHLFAPQRKNETRQVIENIAKEGRKFGFTLTLVSQRPSEIYANIRAQLQSFMIHKLTDDTDIKKIISSAEGLDSSWGTQIQKLETGEVLFVGDVISTPTFVSVRKRLTKHHEGSEGLFQTSEHAEDESAVTNRQAELEEEVKGATIAQLSQRIDQLEQERNRLRKRLQDDPNVQSDELIDDLESTVEEQRSEIDDLRSEIHQRDSTIEELISRMGDQLESTDPGTENEVGAADRAKENASDRARTVERPQGNVQSDAQRYVDELISHILDGSNSPEGGERAKADRNHPEAASTDRGPASDSTEDSRNSKQDAEKTSGDTTSDSETDSIDSIMDDLNLDRST